MADSREAIRLLESRRYRAMCEGGKPSYLDGIRSKKWVYRKIERPIEDIQVHGDSAVVTGQVRIELLSDGKPKTLNSRFTNVWVKGTKGWQMVAWQSTPLPA